MEQGQQDSVQSKSLCDLPPELIWEIVMRIGESDIGSLAGTCSYIRDAAYDNIVWIRRCKKDFDMQIDPLVAKEAGRGSVWAFYSLILRKFGPFLGPLKQTSGHSEADGHSNHHGAMFQLVHDGGLGLICYDWVPPRVSKGVQQPMSLLHYGSVTLERVDGAIESTSYFKVTHSNPRISIGQCDGSLQVENTYFRDFDFKELSDTDRDLLGEWLNRKDPCER